MPGLGEHIAEEEGSRDDHDDEKRGFEALEKNDLRPSLNVIA